MDLDKNLNGAYVKSYYDGFLSGYNNDYAYYRWQAGPVERIHFYQTRKALLLFLNKVKGSVLEVGGGDAIWTMEYVERADRLLFLDISTEMISRAQKRLASFSGKIEFINEDFLIHDFGKNTFENIVSIRNLEYFVDKKKFMDKVSSLLVQGGNLVLVTKSPVYNLKDKAKEKTLHTAQIGITELKEIIEQAGLSVIDIRPAIFGKLFRYPIMRFFSNCAHAFFLKMPRIFLPLGLLSYFSESFVVYARK